MKKNTLFAAIAVLVSTLLLGCFFQLSVDKDRQNFETLGFTLGAYLKVTHPDLAEKTIPWVEGVLSMSDEEFISQDPINVAYKFLLKELPEDANVIMLAKACIDAFGIQVNVSVDEKFDDNKYIKTAKTILKGYLQGVK